MSFPQLRMRRFRRSPKLREMVREVKIDLDDLICPIFVEEEARHRTPIGSMPGIFRLPVDEVANEAKSTASLAIPALILFGVPSRKDEFGSSAYDENGVVQKAIRAIKREVPDELVVITDVCLCEYTSHGHCGVVEDGKLLNDPTLEILGKVALSHARAGADIVAPSGMIDGQVGTIRRTLDQDGFEDIAIMSYSAKHASCMYGPFREAAEATPQFGDRKSYQMDYANPNEALREVKLDVKEGADIVIVKPALAYLDIILRVKSTFDLPVAAFNVSGEYSMVKAAAERGWIDERSAVVEILTGIKRAGADMIVTYFAKDVARMLSQK